MNGQLHVGPPPDAVERHPHGYAWRTRLHDVCVLSRGEGTSTFSAVGEDAFWIVHDEGTMADFLPDDDPLRSQLITLKRYGSRQRWKEASLHWPRKRRLESSSTQLDSLFMATGNQVGQHGPWKLPTALQHSLRDRLIGAGAEDLEDASTQWRMRVRQGSSKATVALYRTGICTVDGKASAIDPAAQMVLSTIRASNEKDFLDLDTKPRMMLLAGAHFGCDESGKSDFFGPLVTAAIHADGELIKGFCALGVRDCKDLRDERVRTLAAEIYRIAGDGVAVTCLYPEHYNELYCSFEKEGKTLNDLMASAYAGCIKDLLGRGFGPEYVLVDRFSHHQIETLVQATEGRMPVREVYGAEENFAVAAASIVARAAFLEWMEATSESIGIELPKGTDQDGEVLEVARRIVQRDGAESLRGLAKLNVSTIDEVLAPPATGARP